MESKENLRRSMLQMGKIIIRVTYSDKQNELLENFCNFKLQLIDKPYKSRLGLYNMLTRTIQLSSIKTECRRDLIITYLHEISHHIEYIVSGNSGHQKSFYDIHTKLLHTAINLNLLSVSDIVDNTSSRAGNKNKLAKLLTGYKKSGNNSLSDYMDTNFLKILPETVQRKESFFVKCQKSENDILKENGYKWDTNLYAWTKTLYDQCDVDDEKVFLKRNGFYKIKIGKAMFYTRYVNVCISGNTYSHKDKLKEFGYKYSNRTWGKAVPVNNIKKEMFLLKFLPGIKITSSF